MSLTITPAQAVVEWIPASFTVLALTSGSSQTASYQWKKNFIVIASATSSTLTFPSALASDSADYVLSYTGSISGSGNVGVSSSLASHLEIDPVVTSLTVSPSSIAEGQDVDLILVASSSIPMSYTWTRQGTSLNSQVATEIDSTTGSRILYRNRGYSQFVEGTNQVSILTASGSTSASGNISIRSRIGGLAPGVLLWDENQNQWMNS